MDNIVGQIGTSDSMKSIYEVEFRVLKNFISIKNKINLKYINKYNLNFLKFI